MAAGFRKSFLGFNCDDVINYIESAQAKFSRREAELRSQIESANEQYIASLKKINEITLEKDRLLAELEGFKNRCEEIEQLSESIGKLYLVSQNSAKNIIGNSVASSKMANEEIFKNIDSIANAHDALDDIKRRMAETSNEFIETVNSLCASLEDTKRSLVERSADSDKSLEEFTAVFNKINNAE